MGGEQRIVRVGRACLKVGFALIAASCSAREPARIETTKSRATDAGLDVANDAGPRAAAFAAAPDVIVPTRAPWSLDAKLERETVPGSDQLDPNEIYFLIERANHRTSEFEHGLSTLDAPFELFLDANAVPSLGNAYVDPIEHDLVYWADIRPEVELGLRRFRRDADDSDGGLDNDPAQPLAPCPPPEDDAHETSDTSNFWLVPETGEVVWECRPSNHSYAYFTELGGALLPPAPSTRLVAVGRNKLTLWTSDYDRDPYLVTAQGHAIMLIEPLVDPDAHDITGFKAVEDGFLTANYDQTASGSTLRVLHIHDDGLVDEETFADAPMGHGFVSCWFRGSEELVCADDVLSSLGELMLFRFQLDLGTQRTERIAAPDEAEVEYILFDAVTGP